MKGESRLLVKIANRYLINMTLLFLEVLLHVLLKTDIRCKTVYRAIILTQRRMNYLFRTGIIVILLIILGIPSRL